MDRLLDRQLDKWIGQMDVCTYRQINRWINRLRDRQMNILIDGKIDGWIKRYINVLGKKYIFVALS